MTVSKSFALFVVLLFLSFPGFGQNNRADKIIGEWINEDKNEAVEIYKRDDRYFGKLIYAKDLLQRDGKSYPQDVKNPDSNLRQRNLYSIDILLGFQYQDDQWEGGSLYDPKSGRTYSCLMKLQDGTLQIRGYIGIPLLGRSSYWTRTP
ncbi:DUF2147 domain-containing protein [Dyadobacter tibetensis]|uniref:DUF2147 domain-containing protein n=1 Tax=Dyadobacter tibetensis TaxID=1211851 RepID=UPI0005C5BADA|nr:DUF2147 domain-containing protein [Dyadobacter tibetensis]